MPELPEVEAARAAIAEHCLGKKIIKSIIADDTKVIDGVSPKDFEATLTGKTIVAAHRKGKNMWLELDSPPFPTFQYGMAGAVYIKGVAVTKYKRSAVKDDDEWPSKYSKVFVELNDGLEFSFTDKRRFAKVRLLDNPVAVPPISELGPDAFLEPMSVDEFFKSLSKKNIGIKALLLDQGFISGIGNWIADEVLYRVSSFISGVAASGLRIGAIRFEFCSDFTTVDHLNLHGARIHPLQSASSMSKETCERLLNCIHEVIGKAVEVGADSSQFPTNWIFHSREKKGKAFVDGKKIEFITAGGRTTAYVPELQKLSGVQATKEPQKGKRAKGSKNGKDHKNVDEVDGRDVIVKTGEKTSKGRSVSVKGKSKDTLNISRNDAVKDSDSSSGDEDPKNTSRKKPSVGNESKKTTTKKVSKRRKSLESGDSTGDDDENENNRDHKKAKKTKKNMMKQNVESNQNRRSTRKKAQ
ncbi:OLC1v1037517C1 [Oldenlandia corymbosa var. corymbosa]|uniref:OLC1v1037517C1 n=1 Tax=Oldenlandia corymbosa var. corymbosa TaxID=529605 RepID=A0AAV1E195_OLDCO|nr:OLC1v1037517C1 [Oldenlandia corymbosa var. corymbosa]